MSPMQSRGLGLGLGVGMGNLFFYANIITQAYLARVTADGGYYEGTECLKNKLRALT
jgi:hypothetical protein